jgi:excisionase family DNA binding protein
MDIKRYQDDNNSTVMDVKNTSKYLCISEAKLRRLATEKRIPYFRIGGRVLFSRPQIDQWIQAQIVHPTEQQQTDVAGEFMTKLIGG